LHTSAIIQARMGSTRLSGKVMLEISGKPVLWHVINRVSKSKLIDGLVVATTINKEDDIIEKFCNQNSIPVFRGSEDDVLDRYYQCARKFGIKNIVRITADCPLHDPLVIDLVIERYRLGNCDYVSNADPPTYPDGIDVEVLSFDVLEKAWRNASLISEREHVTPYIRKHSDLFRINNVANEEDLSTYRWTLDQAEDFEFIQKIYKKFEELNIDEFCIKDIIGLLEKNPELTSINSAIQRNEGYTKSVNEDKVVKL
jgi:spore coat polysaccharide biosynthesis protein SpsF (cytidylyltransferase family)